MSYDFSKIIKIGNKLLISVNKGSGRKGLTVPFVADPEEIPNLLNKTFISVGTQSDLTSRNECKYAFKEDSYHMTVKYNLGTYTGIDMDFAVDGTTYKYNEDYTILYSYDSRTATWVEMAVYDKDTNTVTISGNIYNKFDGYNHEDIGNLVVYIESDDSIIKGGYKIISEENDGDYLLIPHFENNIFNPVYWDEERRSSSLGLNRNSTLTEFKCKAGDTKTINENKWIFKFDAVNKNNPNDRIPNYLVKKISIPMAKYYDTRDGKSASVSWYGVDDVAYVGLEYNNITGSITDTNGVSHNYTNDNIEVFFSIQSNDITIRKNSGYSEKEIIASGTTTFTVYDSVSNGGYEANCTYIFDSEGWNRVKIQTFFGVDEFLSDETFEHKMQSNPVIPKL